MPTPPTIIVQIVHIEGPLKGQIQEFNKPEISIGRHPSCDVRFPAECGTISRKHAKIIREWNQFRLSDISTNGIFVNGKKTEQIHLKDGDVITVAPNGPKISFLTKVEQVPISVRTAQAVSVEPIPVSAQPEQVVNTQRQPSPQITPAKVSCVIQYGPRLESFEHSPIELGSSAKCSFIIEHPDIRDSHAQIFYSDGQFWLKDLTGQHLVKVGTTDVEGGVPLNANDQISLTPNGPFLIYLGNGRFAELEK